MKAVFHGSLIHHLADTLRAKVRTPWTLERFLESDAKDELDRLARGAPLRYQLR